MKVALEKNYKDWYTMADVERAKMVITAEKDDEMNAKDWAEYMIGEALKGETGSVVEIFKASAYTARNRRAWNLYGEETENMDVWVEAKAETTDGFIQCGAYLSDIWQTGATPYKDHMYIRKASFNN